MKPTPHTISVIQDIVEKENAERLRVYNQELSVAERSSLRQYVLYLMDRARPGNWASRKLDLRFGIDGDVSMDDYGERERRD